MFDTFWRVGYTIFGKYLPCSWRSKTAENIRRFWTSRIVASCGRGVNIERGAEFSNDLVIGDDSGLGVNCEIDSHVVIGNNVMMGPEVVIYTSNHEHKDSSVPMKSQGMTSPQTVVIEDDVWIGRRVIILPGVTIGKGSILGAGAVVSKSIPPYSVAVGNPARVVKKR